VPLSPLATEAVVARAIHGLRGRPDAEYFAPVFDRPGFPGAITATIEELRHGEIEPEQVTRLPRVGPAIAAVMRAMESELAEANLIDRAGVVRLAIAAVGFRPRFVGLPTLLLDVALENALERELIAVLAQAAPALLATLPHGDFLTQRLLSEALGVEPEDLPARSVAHASAERASSSLAMLQDHLFASAMPRRASLDDTVSIASAPGESRECVEIVRAIATEAARGVPFDRMAVLLHSPTQYVSHLQEAFRRAQIPAYFAAGMRRPEPGGRALLALLACAAEGLSARRFGEYLSLAQVPDPERVDERAALVTPATDLTPAPVPLELDGVEAPPLEVSRDITDPMPVVEGSVRAPWRWEELIVEAAVINSRERWQRRLDGLREEIVRHLAELGVEYPARSEALTRRLLDLDHLRAVALPLIDALAALPQAATWGVWLEHLEALSRQAIRDNSPVLATLVELRPMAPVGPVDLEEVRLVLGARLGNLTQRPPRRRYGQVFVGPAAGARGLGFEVVFIPALSERLFPRKTVEDPILPDAERRRLPMALALQADRVAAERAALRIAVGAAAGRVYLSYPRIDIEQGRPRVPSFYALEALRAAEGYLPGFYELADRAAAAQELRLGWPAPPQPELAIDDAEFDLALLQNLAGADADAIKGAAHYLLGANEHLARALRARGRRWLRRWTSADGLVDPDPAALAALAGQQMGARSYSATALQNFAACPYRFFLQAIWRLQPREEPEAIEVIDPLTRGALFHEVQFDLLSELRARAMLPVSAANLAAAQELGDGLLSSRAASYKDRLAPAIDKVWNDGIAAIQADLREWLRRAVEEAQGWCPERFELSFGLSEREQADPASRAEAVEIADGLRLRGSIDLVERHPDGRVRVTDHKTGQARTEKNLVVGGGKTLQPVLYALAAEQLLSHPIAAGRLYYCTAAGGFQEREVPIGAPARAAAAQVVATIGDALREGFLPAAPDKRECERCDYRMVCGPHEEMRAGRKPAARQQPLSRLRGLP
jgi:ATP-dependent helicase/nuclease subunit B